LQNTLVGRDGAIPVFVRDIATVKIGNLPRNGIAGLNNDDDIVQGIVLMRRGAQSMPTIKAVKAEIDHINDSGMLPPGVHLERIYDRSDLIKVTTHTVMENLVVGILLIFFLQWAFLGNLRSALIVAATIPFALAFAVLILTIQGKAPTCCRWARSTSASSSTRRSSWSKTSSATWPNDRTMSKARRTGITLSPAVFPRCFMHRVK
jgi:cobalt-zinc-cadmium resistance protein CzcA